MINLGMIDAFFSFGIEFEHAIFFKTPKNSTFIVEKSRKHMYVTKKRCVL